MQAVISPTAEFNKILAHVKPEIKADFNLPDNLKFVSNVNVVSKTDQHLNTALCGPLSPQSALCQPYLQTSPHYTV